MHKVMESEIGESQRDRELPLERRRPHATFKRGKYQDGILPLTVLRRLDCVLAPTKEKVLGKQAELRGKKLENLDPQPLNVDNKKTEVMRELTLEGVG